MSTTPNPLIPETVSVASPNRIRKFLIGAGIFLVLWLGWCAWSFSRVTSAASTRYVGQSPQPGGAAQGAALSDFDRQVKDTNKRLHELNTPAPDPNAVPMPERTGAQERAISHPGSGQPQPAETPELTDHKSELVEDFSGYFAQQAKDKSAAEGTTPAALVPIPAEPAQPEKPKSLNALLPGAPTYRLFAGTLIEAVQTIRLNGDRQGIAEAMLTSDVYSFNCSGGPGQYSTNSANAPCVVLIPQGTRLLGDVKAVTSQLDEARVYVNFKTMVMPDGFEVNLDNFPALNQIGEGGEDAKVNRHTLSAFGVALALAGIGGVANIGSYSGGYSASTEIRQGIAQSTAQSSAQILNRFLNRQPTAKVHEGTRIRIVINSNIDIPSYWAHRMPTRI